MRFAYLLMVTEANNNKYYKMTEIADRIEVEFGRVGQGSQKTSYPSGRWNSLYNSKIKKGYTDVTELQTVTQSEDAKLTGNQQIDSVLSYLLTASKTSYKNTYSVSGSNITQAQVDAAQNVLNNIVTEKNDITKLRELYLKLFTIIPRTMSNVRDYLPNTVDQALEMHQKEQDNLDNAAVQKQFVTTESEGLLDKLEVQIEPYMLDNQIEEILQNNNSNVLQVFKLIKPSTQKTYEEWLKQAQNKKTILAWHGTNEINILSIMQSSLRVRPTVIAHGSMLGNAAYISQEWQKSRNYTSGQRKFMFIFNVHVGNELLADTRAKIKPYTLQELEKLGYDSVYAPARTHTGWTYLQYSERTIYRSEQLTPAFLLEVK